MYVWYLYDIQTPVVARTEKCPAYNSQWNLTSITMNSFVRKTSPAVLSREIEIQCSEELSGLCSRCHGADSKQIPVQIVQAVLFMATGY